MQEQERTLVFPHGFNDHAQPGSNEEGRQQDGRRENNHNADSEDLHLDSRIPDEHQDGDVHQEGQYDLPHGMGIHSIHLLPSTNKDVNERLLQLGRLERNSSKPLIGLIRNRKQIHECMASLA